MNGDCPLPSNGVIREGKHLFPARVYIEDTDLGHVVYHANYLKYLERARSDLLRAIGIDHRAAIEGRLGVYAVVEVRIKYRKPARLDDDLLIVSWIPQLRPVTMVIEQQIHRGKDLLSDATVTVAFLSSEGRPKRQPEDWLARFQQLMSVSS